MDLSSVGICIPTFNAGHVWKDCLSGIFLSSVLPKRVLILDSSSADGTPELARRFGTEVITINSSEFNHGGTRQRGAEVLSDCEFVVFLTQDAVIDSPESISNLIKVFDSDLSIGVAYGRQLPSRGARPFGAHARLFNYPEISHLRGRSDIDRFGIKAAFVSNSFSAYRRNALLSVGGFPKDIIFGEDMMVAAKMLLAGWKVAYSADTTILHSHDYSYLQEFRRYFDVGVFHETEAWLIREFGKPEGEGWRFVKSEISYLIHHAPWLLPSAVIRNCLKYSGYKMGRKYRYLPRNWRFFLSMNKGYWAEERNAFEGNAGT